MFFKELFDFSFMYFFKSSSYKRRRDMVVFRKICNKYHLYFFLYLDFSTMNVLDKVKSYERKYPYYFSCLFLVIVLLAVLYGFNYGADLDINVPPKELAYISAAVIAGLVGYLIHESTKESEIGKHREKWLSELKEEMAIYISDIEEYCNEIKKNLRYPYQLQKATAPDFNLFIELRELRRSINGRYNKILLFVRTEKDKPERAVYEGVKSVKKRVESIDNMINGMEVNNNYLYHKKIYEKINTLFHMGMQKNILLVKEYCDEEWSYIKKGHLLFRLKRAIILAALLFIVSSFSGYTISYYEKWI